MYVHIHAHIVTRKKGACIHRKYTSFRTLQEPYQRIIPLRRYNPLALRIYCPTTDENRFLVRGLGVEERESPPRRNVTQHSTAQHTQHFFPVANYLVQCYILCTFFMKHTYSSKNRQNDGYSISALLTAGYFFFLEFKYIIELWNLRTEMNTKLSNSTWCGPQRGHLQTISVKNWTDYYASRQLWLAMWIPTNKPRKQTEFHILLQCGVSCVALLPRYQLLHSHRQGRKKGNKQPSI